MSIYHFKARDSKGQYVEGVVEAISTEAAAEIVSGKKLAILEISLQPLRSPIFLADFFAKKVSTKDLVVFFRQLSVMLEANLPLVRALRILSRQTKNKFFQKIIDGAADEVDGGSLLSAALEIYPRVFTKFYVNIIRSGETSGRLSEVMIYLANQKEKDYDVESKVKGAMIYPAFILGALAVVGFIVLTFVIPSMTAMLVESGVTLPLLTRLLIGLSNIFKNYWWLIISLVLAFIVFWNYWLKTEIGRKFFDEAKLRLPIFGKVFQNIYIVRICLSFATLIKGGVPIAVSLGVVKDVVDNVIYEQILVTATKSVGEGNQIAASLATSHYIPTVVTQMIAVGEESGKLEEILEKVADFYSREIDNTVSNLSSLLEPIIMIILGLAVGVFVAAVILPMWQLSSSF